MRVYARDVRFGVLGTLTVSDDEGRALRLGGPARRRLLAALLARAPSPVRVDTLVDDLWSDVPPPTAERTLHSHVARLRSDLTALSGGSIVLTEPMAYRLAVDPGCIDSVRFELGLEQARDALGEGDPASALDQLDRALSLWRGEAYAEFPDAPFAVMERTRLTELRSLAREWRAEAALRLGESASLVPELETRVAGEPYRERSWEQLMLALYRSGRQAEALAAFRRARDLLVDDLGVEPSDSLRELESRILDHDPALLLAAADLAPAIPPRLAREPAARGVVDGPGDDDGTPASEPVPGPAPSAACPFPGLAAYDESDADVFVGRERLVAQLVGRIVEDGLLVVVGASGVGKSSVVRAGVVPAVRRGAAPGSAAWRVRVVSPSAGLDAALDEALAGDLDLLVVDQAEELFTLAGGTGVARGRRLGAVRSRGTRLMVVVRTDFYDRLLELDLVAGRIGSATVLVGVPSESDLRRVVVEPCARRGVTVDEELVDRIVADLLGRPGALPLLSESLRQAWQHHADGHLTMADYRAVGGVRGALQSTAERAYAELDEPARAAARRLLLSLTTNSGGVWVRRPSTIADLCPPGDEPSVRALAALARARLVTVAPGDAGPAAVELAHEALLDGWPRFATWLRDRAVMAEQLDQLAEAARRWEQDGWSDDDLLRGPRLGSALAWEERHPDDLTGRQRAYLEASRAAVHRDMDSERRRRRAMTVLAAGFALAALLASVVGGVALRARQQADEVATTAEAGRLAAQSYAAPDARSALQLSLMASAVQDSPQTRGALFSAVQRERGTRYRIATDRALTWLGVPAAGAPLLALDSRDTLLTLDASTGSVVSSVAVPASAGVADLSRDGRTVLAAEATTRLSSGRLCLVDVASGTCVWSLTRRIVSTSGSAPAAFAHDDRWIVALEHRRPENVWTYDPAQMRADTVTVYDNRNRLFAPRALSTGVEPTAIATGADRVVIAYADGLVAVRQLPTLRLVDVVRMPSPVRTLAMAPDGAHVGVVLTNSPLLPRVLEVGSMRGIQVTGRSLAADSHLLRFSPAGDMLAAAGKDGSLLVLSTATGTTVLSGQGDPGATSGLVWAGTAADPLVVIAGRGGQVVGRDLDQLPPGLELGVGAVPADGYVAAGDVAWSTRLTPGSVRVVATDLTSHATLLDLSAPMQPDEVVVRLSLSADGSRAALSTQMAGGRGHVRVWGVGGTPLLDTTERWAYPECPLTAVLSADGRTLYQVVGATSVRVVDLASNQVAGVLDVRIPLAGGGDGFPSLLGEDGKGLLVVVGAGVTPAPSTPDGTVRPAVPDSVAAVSASTGEVAAYRVIGGDTPTTWALSADAALLALGTDDGVVAEHAWPSLTSIGRVPNAHEDGVTALSYSPDGALLLTTGSDGSLRLWDAGVLDSAGSRVRLRSVGPLAAWFAGGDLISGYLPLDARSHGADTTFTMPGDPDQWRDAACRISGGVSAAEWRAYAGAWPVLDPCPAAGR